jgi:peptidoglycan/LPS O-acetylase OafA/YrhL
LTYTSNFYFYNRQNWDGIISHLWSLAIEEQFYLIWPWIILFSNKKYLAHIIIAFILVGVVSQWLLRGYSMFYVLTPTCFDCFGLGALLSWITVFRRHQLDTFYKWLSIAATFSFVIYCALVFLNTPASIPKRSFTAIIALWLITYIARNTKNEKIKFGFILNNEILLFLGKISYGLYIYHNIIPRVVTSDFVRLKLNAHLPNVILNHKGALLGFECGLLLLVVAWASYILIEKPFLQLKKYFDYEHVPTTQQVVGHT